MNQETVETKVLEAKKRSGRWKLLVVIAICASPLFASYFTYYVIKPESRTNYGTILDPRAHELPSLAETELDGTATSLEALRGKWLMIRVGVSECEQTCQSQLHDMRQLRTAQGKERDRLERVWLITDENPVETIVLREYDGTHFIRVDPQAIEFWLPTEEGTTASDHIYMMDPLGNLMMRFPKDADPNRIKRDLYKLLKASRIG